MTRNLWGWDQRADQRATDKARLRERLDLRDQGERQRKDWRYGLFEPAKGPPLAPEDRCEHATCQCEWCVP